MILEVTGCIRCGEMTFSQGQGTFYEKKASGMGNRALDLASGDQGWSLGDMGGRAAYLLLC